MRPVPHRCRPVSEGAGPLERPGSLRVFSARPPSAPGGGGAGPARCSLSEKLYLCAAANAPLGPFQAARTRALFRRVPLSP